MEVIHFFISGLFQGFLVRFAKKYNNCRPFLGVKLDHYSWKWNFRWAILKTRQGMGIQPFHFVVLHCYLNFNVRSPNLHGKWIQNAMSTETLIWKYVTAVRRNCTDRYEIWALTDHEIYYIKIELDLRKFSNGSFSKTEKVLGNSNAWR